MRRLATAIAPFVLISLLPTGARAQSIDWTRQLGSTEYDVAWGVVATDTDVYIDGFTTGELPGQTSVGGYDGFLTRIDAAGNEVWTIQFGTARDDVVVALGMDATGLYVTGQTFGKFPGQTKLGGGDGFVQKYDLDGNEVWTTQFGTDSGDFPSNVVADAGGVYVVGSTAGAFPGEVNRGSDDIFLTRFDPTDGAKDWTDQFGSRRSDIGYANAVGTAGVFVNGFTEGRLPGQDDRGGTDAFVGLYATDGTRTWLRQFGTGHFDAGYGIVADDTGVYVSGETRGALGGLRYRGNGDAYVRKFSPVDGSTTWTREFGSGKYDASYGVAVFGDEVYPVGSTAGSLPGQSSEGGGSDAFVEALDAADGSSLWILQFGTRRWDDGNWAWAVSGAVYMSGITAGRMPGETHAGSYDAFVSRITTTLAPGAARRLAGCRTWWSWGAGSSGPRAPRSSPRAERRSR